MLPWPRLVLGNESKGYDHWGQAIGGEASALNVLPVGKRLIFQAVVTAHGATVKRDRPITVRRG